MVSLRSHMSTPHNEFGVRTDYERELEAEIARRDYQLKNANCKIAKLTEQRNLLINQAVGFDERAKPAIKHHDEEIEESTKRNA